MCLNRGFFKNTAKLSLNEMKAKAVYNPRLLPKEKN